MEEQEDDNSIQGVEEEEEAIIEVENVNAEPEPRMVDVVPDLVEDDVPEDGEDANGDNWKRGQNE